MSLNQRGELALFIAPEKLAKLNKSDLSQCFTNGVYRNIQLAYPRDIIEGDTFLESLSALLMEHGSFDIQKIVKEDATLTSLHYDRISEKFSPWNETQLLELMNHLVSLGFGAYLAYTHSEDILGEIKEYKAKINSYTYCFATLLPLEKTRLEELTRKEQELTSILHLLKANPERTYNHKTLQVALALLPKSGQQL